MLRLTVLGSGSAGNAALVQSGDTCLLVDAGLSAKQLTLRMQSAGVEPEDVDGILLTHEHGDHVRGLDVLCRKHGTPVFCNELTKEMLTMGLKYEKSWRIVPTGRDFDLAGLKVHAFSVTHDAADPIGYIIDDGESRLGVLSDVGHITKLVEAKMTEVDTLFVESNYDQRMLENDLKRPWSTKQRIMARHGHLSNADTARFVAGCASDRLCRVVLGHLSRDCNEPELAERCTRTALGKIGYTDVEVMCAMQDQPTATFEVAREPVIVVPERESLPSPVLTPMAAMVQGELFS